MQDQHNWYVVHTKPRQERIALEHLKRQEFEVYLPLFKVFKKPGRRSSKSLLPATSQAGAHTLRTADGATHANPLTAYEPMFARYLFLRPSRSTQSLAVVRSTVGVSRLLMFGHQPAMLADDALQAISQAVQLRNQASMDTISPYTPGMPVRMLDPAFAGLEALVQAVSKERVTILLEILGRPQSIQVEFARLAPK